MMGGGWPLWMNELINPITWVTLFSDREAVQEAVQELVQEAVREVVQEVNQEVVHQAARMIGDVERGVPVRADENQNLLTTANATTLQRQPMQKKRRRKPVGVHRRLQRRNIRRFPRRKFVQILPVAQIPLLVVEKSRRIGWKESLLRNQKNLEESSVRYEEFVIKLWSYIENIGHNPLKSLPYRTKYIPWPARNSRADNMI